MDFRVLGPLTVREGDRALKLGGYRQQLVLAVLLLHPEARAFSGLPDRCGVGRASPPLSSQNTPGVLVTSAADSRRGCDRRDATRLQPVPPRRRSSTPCSSRTFPPGGTNSCRRIRQALLTFSGVRSRCGAGCRSETWATKRLCSRKRSASSNSVSRPSRIASQPIWTWDKPPRSPPSWSNSLKSILCESDSTSS